jgi:hypothetical protein
MRFKKEIPFLILLAGVVLAFFYRTIIFGLLPVPSDTLNGMYYPWRDLYAETNPNGIPFKNFLITDPVRQQIPWRKLVVGQWKAAELPSWNGFNLAGYSLAGNIQAAPFFPGNFLFLLLDFPVGWTALIILSHLAAAWGMYLFGRISGFSRTASLLGGIVYAFSGFAVSWSQWGTIVWVAAFIPFSLSATALYFQTKVRKRQILWIFAAAFFLALSFLSGHTQIFLYGFILNLFYAWWCFLKTKTGNLRNLFFFYSLLFSVFGLLSWFQLFPSIRSYLVSARFSGLEPRGDGWFFPWQHLVQFLAPDFFGNPATLNYRGVWNYGEFNGYVGVTVLVLAITAIFAKYIRNGFFRWVLIFSLIGMTVNPFTIIFDQLRLPVFSTLQPSRLIFLTVFSLIVLGMHSFDRFPVAKARPGVYGWVGIGIILGLLLIMASVFASRGSGGPEDHWLVTQRNLILPIAVYLVSFIFYFLSTKLAGNKTGLVFRFALILLVLFDLFRMGWKFLPFTPQSYFYPETELTSYLKKNQKFDSYRTVSVDPTVLPANSASFYGIRMLEGYDSLIPERTEEYLAAAARNSPDIARPFGFNRIIGSQTPYTPLYEIAGVKRVLSRNELIDPKLKFEAKLNSVNIYEIASPAAHFYLARYLDFAGSRETALAKLFGDFISGESVVLETLVELPSEGLGAETVKLLNSNPGFWEFSVETSEDRVFVLNEAYDSAWEAVIDGKPVKIMRANFLFQAVVVPAGSHRVFFRYHPVL